MRLNQFVARSSGLSRRAADTAIRSGEVTVNHRPGRLGQSVQSGDSVSWRGRSLSLPIETTTIIFHKPPGYVCSRQRQGRSPLIYELLPSELAGLKSVGRLDRNSSGLLVLTDDGRLANRLSHPSFGKTKRYLVTIDRPLLPTDRDRLERGVRLDSRLSRLQVLKASGPNLTLELTTGINRQIRRSLTALGYRTLTLKRTDFGPLKLGSLESGRWRRLTPEEATWLA